MPNDTYIPRGHHPVISQPGTGRVAAGNPAVLLRSANTSRRGVTLMNLGADDVYYGFHSGVTDADGFRLQSGESQPIGDVDGAIYVYTAGAADVQFVET